MSEPSAASKCATSGSFFQIPQHAWAPTQTDMKSSTQVGLASQMTTRNAGVSVLGCGICMVAVGGCATGIGQLFGCMVVGMARNPSMRDDLFTYTLVGIGFLEFLAIVVILFAMLLLYSE